MVPKKNVFFKVVFVKIYLLSWAFFFKANKRGVLLEKMIYVTLPLIGRYWPKPAPAPALKKINLTRTRTRTRT